MNKNKNESGQSLFESVIAISVVGVALISLVGLTISAIGSATLAKNQTLATKYTQEALEWLRGERDRNWNQFLSHSTAGGSRYCLNILPTGNWNTGTCGSGENIDDTELYREVILVRQSVNVVIATVITYWNDNNGIRETRTTTNFTNWKGR